GSNKVLEDLNNNKFEIVYLLGLDIFQFKKKNEFIIYQGSHGDKGAEIANIILPGAAYTEQNGYFTNLEGKLQKAYKASYPPEEAKEDWLIINELAEAMNHRKLFNDKDELDSSMLNYLNLYLEKDNCVISTEIKDLIFEDEILKITNEDYYYSNVIARASKTMFECKSAKTNFKYTGTEG
ncbi:molybdopterin-dependent oxidoreductase, partial [Candidatus Pelagibacter sp.]|nr:molybdopterin-dependent oxidoreductase [Candidatus Pelagibacter sp.]